MNTDFLKASEVCEVLGITIWTLTNWYQWERLSLEDGTLPERVLPIPTKDDSSKGKPRLWTMAQVEELKKFQHSIIKGRNGIMAKVTNPKSRHAKR